MKVIDLSLALSGRQIFQGFSAEFPEPGISFILGPSGSGKTTLLRLILGLTKADGGQIIGNDKTFAVVFQEDRLLPELDIAHNLDFVTNHPLRPDLLEQLGLSEYQHQPVAQLSGGTRRRVALLRALQSDYDCLVLDEPFAGLEDALKVQVAGVIAREAAGKTVLIATHEHQMLSCFASPTQILLDGGE